ncbi:MAG: hypothetical protein IIZ59_00665, partial [Clostridia bacterium]|nr:hypothetical protein [Clostridia bacterium]
MKAQFSGEFLITLYIIFFIAFKLRKKVGKWAFDPKNRMFEPFFHAHFCFEKWAKSGHESGKSGHGNFFCIFLPTFRWASQKKWAA